jgi:diamine N-acetyltransferase
LILNLQGENIFLRALEPEDVDLLYSWENNTEHWHISNTLVPFSKALLHQYVNSAQDIFLTKQLRFIICLKSDGKAIGAIDLFDFEPFHQRAGIGIIIAEDEQKKKGYASDALDVLIDYCFDVLLLHQVYCNINQENEASVNLFLGKEFSIVGLKKDWNRSKDGYSDELLLQLLNYRSY